MVPQLLWLSLLLLAAVLALRAMTQGGPLVDIAWRAVGLAGLFVFGGEIPATLPVLFEAIQQERAWGPNPALQAHVVVVGLLVLFRPDRRRSAA